VERPLCTLAAAAAAFGALLAKVYGTGRMHGMHATWSSPSCSALAATCNM